MFRTVYLRTSVALFILGGAACSETLAPRLERIQSRIANALTCTIDWTGMAPEADNDWRNPGNWAPQRMPNASDNVCITADGSFAQLFGDANVNSVTIGTPGSANPARLAVRGLRVGTGYFNLPANLNVASGIENHGVLSMDATGHGPGAATINISGGALENRADGKFVSLSKDFGTNGGDLTHYVNGNVANDGLLDFRTSVAMKGQWTNRGVARLQQVANAWDSPFFYILTGGSWIQAGGSLDVAGTFEVHDGLVRLEGGAISGSEGPIALRGSVQLADGATVSGNVTLRETVAMTGNVPTGLTVIVAGHRSSTTGFIYNTFVTAANGFNNNGTIRLTGTGHVNGSGTQLIVSNGTLVNLGRIETLVPEAGERTIRASIRNLAGATIAANAGLLLDRSGAAYVNEGTITVGSAQRIDVNDAAVVELRAGALTLGSGAQFNQMGGSFKFDGGAVTGGIPRVHETNFSIAPASTATGTLQLTGNTRLTGDVQAGQKLLVETIKPFSTGPSITATLTVAGNTVNRGTITLWATGSGAGPAFITVADGATLTNAAGARIEVLTDYDQGNSSNGRQLRGNFVNEGTLYLATDLGYGGGTMKSLAPATVTNSANNGGLLRVDAGATLYASGSFGAHLHNMGNLHIGAPGQPGQLDVRRWYDGTSTSTITVDIGGSPAAPGADFDRVTLNGPMTIGNGTLHVRTLSACVDGGKSFDVVTYTGPSGDFASFTGLDLGNGRTVQPEPLQTSYRLKVVGPVCPPPDATPPVISASVTGTAGNMGWYTSNVTVTWSVTDAESPVTSQTGCEEVTLTTDNAGITYTCSATSAGGSDSRSVTIKRDATPPVVSASRAPAANAHGWNNVNVTATYTATDATSGLVGAATATQLFSSEGPGQSGSHTFTDNAGNTATAGINGISIDKTAPSVDVTRSPLPDATGWNNTDVTATWSASDALSGVDGSNTATHLFNTDGAGQTATRSFSDRAGNGASATITNININKTPPPPPPPPPTLSPVCSATPNEIWPANNKLVSVRVSVGGTGVSSYTLRSVTNNETGTADVSGWTLGTADVEGMVLAKRNGGGTGRTYTLTYDVFGASGAAGSCAVTVRVPHDQSGKSR